MATEKAKAMGIDLIKRGIIKPVCLAFSHPFLLSTASFVVVIYKYRPSIFGFLVSSSPVTGCALVFLWILLKSGKDGGGEDGGNVNRSLQLRRRRRKTMGSSNGDNASGVGCPSRRTKMERFAAFDETSSDSGDDAAVIGPILDTGTTDGLLSESESETLSMENEEEEEEVRDDNAEAESVMKWTADDEKNVRDVRTSELERNLKLEHLMSMRRSMNYLRSRSDDDGDGTEKRLIDFDNETSKAAAVEEELDRILPVALIVPRKNPFDSDGEEEGHAEADAPGSAPSVLIPRMNPFDVEADDDDHGFAGTSNGAVAVDRHHRQGEVEAAGFLRRNETFTLGVSLSDHNRYERRISRFRPYFVPERIGSDGTSYSVLHRQMSGITAETESVGSSVSDHSSSSHVDLVIHSDDDDDEIHGVISRFTISSHTEDDDYDDKEEEEEDKTIRNSTSSDSSVALVIADSDADAHHQSVEPVYDSSPTEIETPESNSASIEIEAEALVYLKKDNHRLITESEELAAADFYNDSAESDGVVPTPAMAAAAALNPRRLLPWNTAKEEGLLVPPSPPSNFADVERPIEIMPTIIEDDLDESRHDEDETDDVTTMKGLGIPETTKIPSKNVIIASI